MSDILISGCCSVCGKPLPQCDCPPAMSSDTPITDAATRTCKQHFDQGGWSVADRDKDPEGDCVDADTTRNLERQASHWQAVATALAETSRALWAAEEAWDNSTTGDPAKFRAVRTAYEAYAAALAAFAAAVAAQPETR